jgi:hypothetical protein
MPINCHGLGCTSTDLIDAHFMPQAFPRRIQKRSRVQNTTVSELRFTQRIPHGLFDNEILCDACDQFLGREYDKPAFELINALSAMEFARPKFEIPNVNCDLLSAFILAVLWRCSISKMFDVSNINLSDIRTPHVWCCGTPCPSAICALTGSYASGTTRIRALMNSIPYR